MSTKAIEAVMAYAADVDFDHETMAEARKEFEAIKRAAKDATQGSVTHRLMASDEGVELALLLESIAKEAP